jgi:aerobic-type carbon monoxide dehydrogenase small subunit (CoxS/CutS family)
MNLTINVNGIAHNIDVEADMPLLWVLRDVLGMTGTKFGCGAALCGACTVHMDGTPIRSCVMPVGNIADRAITSRVDIMIVGNRMAREQSCGCHDLAGLTVTALNHLEVEPRALYRLPLRPGLAHA